jgi:FkbM family methyltransferase
MNSSTSETNMPRHYWLLRRAASLFARFFGAAATFGLARALRLYLFDFQRSGDSSVWVPLLGRRVCFRGKSDYLALTLLFQENFHVEPVNFQVRSVVDLGANIGIETLRFTAFYPAAKIIAVEADGDNYHVLRQNTAGSPRIEALHAAAWGTQARFRIERDPHSNMSSVVSLAPDGDVPAVTIADLIDQLGVRELDILKIDVEGAEDSLFGPTVMDWIGRVRVIVWELNDHEVQRALTRLVLAMARAGVSFNFHIRGEKLIGVRADTSAVVRYPCGLLSLGERVCVQPAVGVTAARSVIAEEP